MLGPNWRAASLTIALFALKKCRSNLQLLRYEAGADQEQSRTIGNNFRSVYTRRSS